MKKAIVVFITLFILFICSGCSFLYNGNFNDDFFIGYSPILNDAFIGTYEWDGTQEGMNICTPEEYNGAKISTFGGYTGRGVPSTFTIEFPESVQKTLCSEATEWIHADNIEHIENYKLHCLNFNVHISKNIEKIENLDLGGFIYGKYAKDGISYYDVYLLLCNVTCDVNNKTFYSKGGKLYYKKNNELVTGIFYTDFDIEKLSS